MNAIEWEIQGLEDFTSEKYDNLKLLRFIELSWFTTQDLEYFKHSHFVNIYICKDSFKNAEEVKED